MGLLNQMTMLGVTVLLNLLVVAPAATAATRNNCPAGYFLPLPVDSLLDECKPCSTCPVNEIIRRPCTDVSDTVCGPFYEFENFNSFQGEMDLGKLMEQYGKGTDSPGAESQEGPEDSPQQSEKMHTATGQKAPSVQTGEDHWKELCFGLITALVIVTLSAVLYIVISQVLRLRRLRKHASPLHDEADVTVYYRTDGQEHIYQQHCPHHQLHVPRTYKPVPFSHLEAQLDQNQRYRHFWQRFLRPGSAQILGGNEYIVTVDNLHNQEALDQRRLLPVNVLPPEEEAQVPLAHVHYEDLQLPDGAGANVSLHSSDSGIVAGPADHPHSSHV